MRDEHRNCDAHGRANSHPWNVPAPWKKTSGGAAVSPKDNTTVSVPLTSR